MAIIEQRVSLGCLDRVCRASVGCEESHRLHRSLVRLSAQVHCLVRRFPSVEMAISLLRVKDWMYSARRNRRADQSSSIAT